MDTHTSWKNVLVFILKTIATLALLSLVLTNIVLSLTQMEGCEGRPDLSLHLVLAIAMALILGFYIYLGHIDITKGMDEDDMTEIGRRFGCDLEAQNRMFFMANVVFAVQLLCCGAYLGFYHLYSTAILPRACTYPPSTLAKVYYWSVAGITGLIGLGCALFGICVLGYLAVMQAKKWLAKYKDHRQLRRLLQTVNDVNLTQSSAARLTFLLTHLQSYLFLGNEFPLTASVALKIFIDTNINLCTVSCCDVCGEDERILTKCVQCEESFERTDFILLFFDTFSDFLRHRDCSLSLLAHKGAIGVDWEEHNSALEAIRNKHQAKSEEWSIEAIRKERVEKAREIVVVEKLSQLHDSHALASEKSNESNLPTPCPFSENQKYFRYVQERRARDTLAMRLFKRGYRYPQESSVREEPDDQGEWMDVGSLYINLAPRRHRYKGRGRRRYWRRMRMMRMSRGR